MSVMYQLTLKIQKFQINRIMQIMLERMLAKRKMDALTNSRLLLKARLAHLLGNLVEVEFNEANRPIDLLTPKRFYSGFRCISLALGHVGLDRSSQERFRDACQTYS